MDFISNLLGSFFNFFSNALNTAVNDAVNFKAQAKNNYQIMEYIYNVRNGKNN